MRALQLAAIGILFSVCGPLLAAQSSRMSQVNGGANSCQWQAAVAPDVVRSPVQMDIHAAYRIFAFQSGGTLGYTLRGQFPYAAFLSFTVYNGADALLHSALLDYRIQPDDDSVNPFTEGELVNARNRSYTVTLLPDGAVANPSMPNPIFLPPPPRGSNVVTAVLVQRIYLAEPRVQDRFGGVEAPTIEPFELSDPSTPAACPSGDFSAITAQFGSLGSNFSHSPLPRNGEIEFYRPPASQVPYTDGSGPLGRHDCTGYLMATVFPDQIAVIHFPTLPTFFDNTDTTRTTTFEITDVRYVSLGSYGASPLSASENENIAGPDIKKLPDGSATFVAIPIRLPSSLKEQVVAKAVQLGYNVMPLAEAGPVIKPFLTYRNKVAAPGFVGDIHNVPCYQGSSFDHAPSADAASPASMGPYAPHGIECSPLDFLSRGCGQ